MTIAQTCLASNISDCGTSDRSRNGYCNKHYLQIKRTGAVKTKTNRDNRDAVFSDGVWKIPLGTNAKVGFAIVDEEFKSLDKYKWYTSCGYAVSKIDDKMKKMHRLIVDAQVKEHVDHINRNKLDNRKHNLRRCTSSQNSANTSTSKNNTTGFKGVFKQTYSFNYFAQIKKARKVYYIGSFKTAIEAAQAYDKKAIELFGEYTLTNKKMGLYNE